MANALNLVVIAKLNVVGLSIQKPETNAPLIVYGNGVLSLAIPMQRMQTITRWHSQIRQSHRGIELVKLANGAPDDRL
jgi:hypothetical protein